MSKLSRSIGVLLITAATAIHGAASAGWLGPSGGPADLVAGGKTWNVITIESDDGFNSVTFLPAGKTAEEAAETLTFIAAIEDAPSSAYDAQATIDQSHNNENTRNYRSHVSPQDRSVRARALYLKVPGRAYSQLISLKGTYLNDGKTFHSVAYRVNVIANSELTKQPGDVLDIMDKRVAKISSQQIRDWFKYFYAKAKKRLAKKKTSNKKTSNAPKS